jgi:hypothetical protein
MQVCSLHNRVSCGYLSGHDNFKPYLQVSSQLLERVMRCVLTSHVQSDQPRHLPTHRYVIAAWLCSCTHVQDIVACTLEVVLAQK